MGAASRALCVILRVTELAMSVVVLGLISNFIYEVNYASAPVEPKLVYTLVIACISTLFSLVFIVPLLYTFLAFAFDFIMFATWLVAFVLMEVLTGINTCNSTWYFSYWGFFWGGFWVRSFNPGGPADIDWAGCAAWRTVLAFSLMLSIFYLMSSALGAYVVSKRRVERRKEIQPRDAGGVVKEQPVGAPANREAVSSAPGTTAYPMTQPMPGHASNGP